MMKCGHAANAEADGKPVCVICALIHPGWNVVNDNPPDLTGRHAHCYCGKTAPSNPDELAFFEHRSDLAYDIYYCGHDGWD